MPGIFALSLASAEPRCQHHRSLPRLRSSPAAVSSAVWIPVMWASSRRGGGVLAVGGRIVTQLRIEFAFTLVLESGIESGSTPIASVVMRLAGRPFWLTWPGVGARHTIDWFGQYSSRIPSSIWVGRSGSRAACLALQELGRYLQPPPASPYPHARRPSQLFESRLWDGHRKAWPVETSNISGANELWEPSGEASVERHEAMPGHMQLRKPWVNATQGHAQPHVAAAGVCMACKRSRY